jgi:hypothetical protein
MNPITDFGSAVEHATGLSWKDGETRYVVRAAGQFIDPNLFGDYEVISHADLRSLREEPVILAETAPTEMDSYVGVVSRDGYEHLASLYYQSQHDEVPAGLPRTFTLHEMQQLVLFSAETPINLLAGQQAPR